MFLWFTKLVASVLKSRLKCAQIILCEKIRKRKYLKRFSKQTKTTIPGPLQRKNHYLSLQVCWVKDKFDLYTLQVAEGEVRASLLQREVERLSQALRAVQEDESLLREKTSSLKKSLQEAAASHSSTQSRMAALQKMLTEAEQDKRLLQVSEMDEQQERCW